jgi:hypothetical protein
LRIDGVHAPPSQLVEAPAHWPSIALRVHVARDSPEGREHLGDRTAKLQIHSGGSVLIERDAQRATFFLSKRPTPSALLHPHLAAVAAVASHWRGRIAFHAGAFVAGGGVWGLLGEKGSGKSSALAALAARDVPIVCDDVLVLAGDTAFAGPRSIDLRTEAARVLGEGEPLGVIGDRERWRMALGEIEPELAFRGWVSLRWADRPAVRPLRGSDRLRELLGHLALRVPPVTPTALMEYAAYPFLELRRPRDWSSMDDALERLLAAVSD